MMIVTFSGRWNFISTSNDNISILTSIISSINCGQLRWNRILCFNVQFEWTH